MGCCGSAQAAFVQKKLDEIDATIKGTRGTSTDETLQTLKKCSQDLADEMNKIIEAGATDDAGMRRIESMSEDILQLLLGMLSAEVIGGEDGPKVIEKVMGVAKELDPVRMTKASVVIEQHVDKTENDAAAPHVRTLKSTLAQITEPAKLKEGARRVIEAAKKANELVPRNTNVTDQLLKGIIELATKIMKFQEVWLVNATGATEVKKIAEEVDELAAKLVVVMESSWDPPFTPQVDRAAQDKAQKEQKAHVAECEKDVAAGKGQSAMKHLEALLPWWPFMQSSSLEVVGAFSKVQTYVLQEFMKFTKSGNSAATENIKKFGTNFDDIRAKFEGLPPPAGGSLASQMESAKFKITAEKQLKVLEEEIAKEHDDDDATNLSLGTTVQAFEALVSVWEAIKDSEPALVEQLEKVCDMMEEWALKAAKSPNTKKATQLLQFSQEYDSRRVQLVPPVTKNGALCPRVALLAVATHLDAVEAELAKDQKATGAAAMNPQRIVDGLNATSKAMGMVDSIDSSYSERQAAAFATTEERVRKSFSDAVANGQERKVEALLTFAESLQEAKAASSKGDAEGEGLVASLKQEVEAGKAVGAKLAEAKVETQKNRGMNPKAVVQVLKDLGPLWEPVSDKDAFTNNLLDILQRFRAKMVEATERNHQQAEPQKRMQGVQAILGIAGEADEAAKALKGPAGAAPPVAFRAAVCSSAADCDLKAMEAELPKEVGFNPKVLLDRTRELSYVWKEASEADAAAEEPLGLPARLEAVQQQVKERMTKSMQEAVEKAQVPKTKQLVQYAEQFDTAYDKVAGEGTSAVKAALEALMPAPAPPGEVETSA